MLPRVRKCGNLDCPCHKGEKCDPDCKLCKERQGESHPCPCHKEYKYTNNDTLVPAILRDAPGWKASDDVLARFVAEFTCPHKGVNCTGRCLFNKSDIKAFLLAEVESGRTEERERILQMIEGMKKEGTLYEGQHHYNTAISDLEAAIKNQGDITN